MAHEIRDAILPSGTYDPLRHNCQDLFWYHIEPSFNPFTNEDLEELHPIHLGDEDISMPVKGCASRTGDVHTSSPSKDERVLSRLRSFPLSQRLVAALLDEGKGQAIAGKGMRSAVIHEGAWMPGSLVHVRGFNRVLEDRVRHELMTVGLFDKLSDDELNTELRLDQWHLRNVVASNNTSRRIIATGVEPELREQPAHRDKKRKQDQIEIQFLERMAEKAGKRGRGRWTKLLGQMHPHRRLEPGAPLARPGGIQNGDQPTGGSKKKRKKSGASSGMDGSNAVAATPASEIQSSVTSDAMGLG